MPPVCDVAGGLGHVHSGGDLARRDAVVHTAPPNLPAPPIAASDETPGAPSIVRRTGRLRETSPREFLPVVVKEAAGVLKR